MPPKVSLVIPTHNRAHYLPEALESALNQTYPHVELIVVNDGSTDETEKVLAPYMKHFRYIKRENGGCAAAKNTGLAATTGELITNLDDDDRIHPEKIARQVEMFLEHPNLGICGTGVNFIDAEGRVTERYMPPRFSPKTQALQLLRRCLLVQSSVMIHRKCHERLGPYKNRLSEDYDFWLRAALHYEVGVVEAYLTDYRQHGDQLTGPKTRPELMAAVEQHLRDFITGTPMEQLIPGLREGIYGDALIGLLLAEQKLYALSQTYLERALPNPAGQLGLGLLRLHERKFAQARICLEQVKAAPFSSKAQEALPLVERVQAILATPGLCNTSLEVVQLRKDLSEFHAAVIRLLLSLARGGTW